MDKHQITKLLSIIERVSVVEDTNQNMLPLVEQLPKHIQPIYERINKNIRHSWTSLIWSLDEWVEMLSEELEQEHNELSLALSDLMMELSILKEDDGIDARKSQFNIVLAECENVRLLLK